MRVIVTGHLGFVGEHLVHALSRAGHGVIGYDKKDRQDLSFDGWADIMASDRPDAIIHLAASCSTLGSILRPEDTFTDTVRTTVTVCKAAAGLGVPLLLTSSVKARDGMTPYGAAKHMSEIWARESGRTFKYPVIINRPGTIYGPGQEGSLESGWIAWFLKAKAEGIPVTINGDGGQVRDLLHVQDYCRLLLLQLSHVPQFARGIWDVGGGHDNAVTVLQMANYLGLSYEFGPHRYGDYGEYIGINGVPGWEPGIHWRDSGMFDG
jgi:nucleoside-diphosphate-sugar epimerase